MIHYWKSVMESSHCLTKYINIYGTDCKIYRKNSKSSVVSFNNCSKVIALVIPKNQMILVIKCAFPKKKINLPEPF